MLQDNLIKFFEESFRKNSDMPALTDYFTRETLSYYMVSREVAKLHMMMHECGIKDDDRVAIVGRNNPRWVMAFIATITYGAVAVPIMQDFDANDINHIVTHSKSRLLFLSDTFWDIIDTDRCPKLKAAISLSDYRCIYERDGSEIRDYQRHILKHYNARYPKGFLPENISYEAPKLDKTACICYTSGTTGFTKGVMITVGNLTSNVQYTLSKKFHPAGARVMSILPLGHIFGLTMDMLAPLSAGAHVTLMGKTPSVKVLVKALQSVKPYMMCMVPLMMEKVVRKEILEHYEKGAVKIASRIPGVNTLIDPAARKLLMHIFGGEITQVIIGGAPLGDEIEQFLLRIKFPFTVGYGMTECAPLISCATVEEFTPGSCGRIVDRMEARVDSPDPANTPGEVLVRGDNVMEGYYKDKKDTKSVIDRDGWLRTGDIGTLQKDGTLFIRGRMETRILTPDGHTVYPEELESRINVMPCVMESLVTARNGKLVALVVPDYEQADAMRIGMEGIRKMMDQNLAAVNDTLQPHQQISEIALYPSEFEKTPKMSIRRYFYE